MLTKPKVFDCDNYISNSEGERKNQRLNFSIHIYKHLQEKKITYHYDLCQTPFYSHRRLAGILHCPRFQELGLSLFFLSQHF